MKYLNVFALIIVGFSASAQVPKKVVAELFTNTRCSICGALDPNIVNVLHSSEQVIQISYYPSSPYSSCFFSLQNPSENDARTNYYGVYGSTPKLFLQGVLKSNQISVSDLSPLLGQTSDFELRLTHQEMSNDSAMVTCAIIRRGSDTLQNARLFLAAQEDSIEYNAPNGIPRHYGVFRKALSDITGDFVNLPMSTGDSVSIEKVYSINTSWNKNLLSAYAILQKDGIKIVVNGERKKLNINSASSVQLPTSSKYSIYPNPASTNLFVGGFQGKEQFRIVNMLGEVKASGRVVDGRISVSDYPKGIYFLWILTEAEETQIIRFQKD